MTRYRCARFQRGNLHLHLACFVVAAGMGTIPATAKAAPWSPPAADASGDVDERYYSELHQVAAGTSESQARSQAVKGLPYATLSPDHRSKAHAVLSNLALFRRLPTLRFAVDSRAYTYLLQHPDVAVSSWRAMEISKFELRPQGPNVYLADARDGSVGTIEVWKSTPEETLIYCDGAFKSPLVTRPIQARALMRLTTRFFNAEDGTPQAEHAGDVFVAFPSQTVETVARLISPVSHMIADRNFRQLTLYAHLMSTAMERQPAWVESVTRRMDATDQQKQDLLKITEQVRLDCERRTAATLLGSRPAPDVPVQNARLNGDSALR